MSPEADQAIFDRLFDCAKLYVQAGVQVERLQSLLDELESYKQA